MISLSTDEPIGSAIKRLAMTDGNQPLKKGIELIHQSNIKLEQSWLNLESLLEIVKSDKKSTGKLTMVLVDNKPFLEDVEEVIILEEILKQTYESI